MKGTVIYDGQELKLETSAIHQAIEEGIAIVYQELTLVPSMTVGENIFLGKEPVERGVDQLGQALRRYPGDLGPSTIWTFSRRTSSSIWASARCR